MQQPVWSFFFFPSPILVVTVIQDYNDQKPECLTAAWYFLLSPFGRTLEFFSLPVSFLLALSSTESTVFSILTALNSMENVRWTSKSWVIS